MNITKIIVKVTIEPKNVWQKVTAKSFYAVLPVTEAGYFKEYIQTVFKGEMEKKLFTAHVDFMLDAPRGTHDKDILSIDTLISKMYTIIEEALYEKMLRDEKEIKRKGKEVKKNKVLSLSDDDISEIDFLSSLLNMTREKSIKYAVTELLRELCAGDKIEAKDTDAMLKVILGKELLNAVKFTANHRHYEINNLVRRLVAEGIETELEIIDKELQ